MRLKANFVVFVLGSFNLIVVIRRGNNLTITQLSGDSSESSIVVSPLFVVRGFIDFNLNRVHFSFNEHIVDFGVYRKRQITYFESVGVCDNGFLGLSRCRHTLPC